MKAYLKTTFILLLTLAFACKEKPLEFIKLDQFSKIDTMQDNGREYYYKTDCYIVYNYQDNLNNEKAVDSFAYKNRARDLSKYLNYQIVIYKSSDVTSIENLNHLPKIDLPIFYSCDWDYDGLRIFQRVKNIIPDIELLVPTSTNFSKSVKSPNHKSDWVYEKSFSNLDYDLYSNDAKKIIEYLIRRKEWIEEENNDLIEMLKNFDSILSN